MSAGTTCYRCGRKAGPEKVDPDTKRCIRPCFNRMRFRTGPVGRRRAGPPTIIARDASQS